MRKAREAAPNALIVIGASTGGTEAIKDVLTRMPADAPPILIAQHMPEAFTGSFAARLNRLCRVTVREAQTGEPVVPGRVYLAPGHSHLLLKRAPRGYVTHLSRGEPVNHHRPSVDVLFRSVALNAGAQAIAILLTGMGKDGAEGMAELHRAGAFTLAQSRDSCVVFGMPKEAIALGAVDEVLAPDAIARAVLGRIACGGSARAVRQVTKTQDPGARGR